MWILFLLLPISLWANELLEFDLRKCELIFSQEIDVLELPNQKLFGPAKVFVIPCSNQGEFSYFRQGQKVGYFCYGLDNSRYLEEAIRLSLWQGPCLPLAENLSKSYKQRTECLGIKTKSSRCFYENLTVTVNSFPQAQEKNILKLEEVSPSEIKAIYNHLGIRIIYGHIGQLPQGLYFLEMKNGSQKLLWRP